MNKKILNGHNGIGYFFLIGRLRINFVLVALICMCFIYCSAVWADADTWFERQQQEEEMQRIQAENRATMQAAEELHRKKMADEREGEKEEVEVKDDPMARAEAEVLNQSNSS